MKNKDLNILTKAQVAIFDMDYTLVSGPRAKDYYSCYSRAIESIVAKELNLTPAQALDLVNRIRSSNGGRGELAFKILNLGESQWFDLILSLDPGEYLPPYPYLNPMLKTIKNNGAKLVILSDGPKPQIEKIAKAGGIDLKLFDSIYGWEKGKPKPKSNPRIFQMIADLFSCQTTDLVMIGDSYTGDILPALGMQVQTILVQPKRPNGYQGVWIKNIEELAGAIGGSLYAVK